MAGISSVELVKYPKELTDADWQKKKGLLAKAVKTGLGSELKKGEALHGKLDSAKLEADSNAPKTREDLDLAIKQAKDHYKSAVEPLIAQLKQIVKVAEETEKVLSGKKLKDAAAAAAAIAKRADLFSITCKSVDLEASIKRAEERIDKLNQLAAQMLNSSIAKFLKGAKEFLSGDGSAASWNDKIKQNGRSVSNSVRQLENYNKAFWKEFQKFQGFDLGTMKLTGDDEKSKELRLKVVRLAVKQVADIARFKD